MTQGAARIANVRLPIPIAAFRAHGRLGQLSARSGLYVKGQKGLAVGNLLVG
jgi:hypothetical protein